MKKIESKKHSGRRIGFEIITHGSRQELGRHFVQFMESYHEFPVVEAMPPCEGARIVSQHTWSECDGVYWQIKERTVWKCPDGNIQTTEVVIQETDQECS